MSEIDIATGIMSFAALLISGFVLFGSFYIANEK